MQIAPPGAHNTDNNTHRIFGELPSADYLVIEPFLAVPNNPTRSVAFAAMAKNSQGEITELPINFMRGPVTLCRTCRTRGMFISTLHSYQLLLQYICLIPLSVLRREVNFTNLTVPFGAIANGRCVNLPPPAEESSNEDSDSDIQEIHKDEFEAAVGEAQEEE